MAPNNPQRRGTGGPKTAAGKARSAHNALTHGLSAANAAIWAAQAPEVARLAALVAGPRPSPARLSLAHDFAAAHIDVGRARLARREILARPQVDPPPSTGALVKAYREVQAGAPGAHARRVGAALGGPRAIPPWEAAAARLRELCGVERHERRAFSRRQSALRALDALALEEAAAPPPDAAPPDAAPSRRAAPDMPAAGGTPPRRETGAASRPAADDNLAERTQAPAPATQAGPPAGRKLAERTRAPARITGQAANPSPLQVPKTKPPGGTTAAPRSAPDELTARERQEAEERVATLTFLGYSEARIAALLNTTVDRLRARFADALDLGPALTEAQIAHALLCRACEGNTRAAIFFLKARAGWRTTGPPPSHRSPPRGPSPEPTMDAAEKRRLFERLWAMAAENRTAPGA